jgi:hypothetical protein
MDHWPYVQTKKRENGAEEPELQKVKSCFEDMSRHSYLNIMKGASYLAPTVLLSLGIIVNSLY